jgi:hypothetical protein
LLLLADEDEDEDDADADAAAAAAAGDAGTLSEVVAVLLAVAALERAARGDRGGEKRPIGWVVDGRMRWMGVHCAW